MMMYDPIAITEEPAARPSRPSARLTAFDVLAVMSTIQTMNKATPRPVPKTAMKSKSRSRTNEMAVDAGVSPFRSR